jgi:hypothetical protein
VSDYYVYRCDVMATVPSSLSSTKLLLSVSISPSSFPHDELMKGFQGGVFASSIALGNASPILSAIDARSLRSQSSRKDLTRTLYKDLQVEDPMYACLSNPVCLLFFVVDCWFFVSVGWFRVELHASVPGSICLCILAMFIRLEAFLYKTSGSLLSPRV